MFLHGLSKQELQHSCGEQSQQAGRIGEGSLSPVATRHAAILRISDLLCKLIASAQLALQDADQPWASTDGTAQCGL